MPSTPQSARKHRAGLSRIAAACERCRKRKQKCDAKRPSCGPCSAIGVECIMSDRLMVVTNPNCSCDELRNQVAELQAHIDSLRAELAREKDSNSQLRTEIEKNATQSQNGLLTAPLEDLPPAVHESTLASNAMVYRILRPTFGDGDVRNGVDTDRLDLAWRLWHNDQSTETPSRNTSSIQDVPINQYGKELVDIFFENCWPQLPILHQPSFMRDHYEPVSQGSQISPISTFQVFMVFAIAAGAKPTTKSGYTFIHRDFFQRAIQDISYVMTLSDFDYLQCLLLMCMYGRNEPQCVNMWHTTGLALRTAISLNFHRHDGIVHGNLYECEMSKRLFWSAYVMDRNMAIAMGRPLGIQDSDITTSLPLQHTDDQLTAQIPMIQPTSPKINDTSTFIHVIKLRRLNADIYQTFHSAGAIHLNDDSINNNQLTLLRDQFNQQINHWLVTAPRYILSTSMQQSPEWFQLAYHHAILSLHRPSHATPVPTLSSLRLCADASISLISCYGSLYAKNKVSYSFIALNSIFMAAITMLYTLRASANVRQDLSKAVTQTNINTCLALFRGISGGREIAERCAGIVGRLGRATLALFERGEGDGGFVDVEFLSWFGLMARSGGSGSGSNGNGAFLLQSGGGGGAAAAEDGNANANANANANGDANENGQQDVLINGGAGAGQLAGDLDGPPTAISIESAWQEFFAPGFEMEGSTNLDFFPMGML